MIGTNHDLQLPLPTLDFELVYACLAFGSVGGMRSPLVDQAFAEFVADTGGGVDFLAWGRAA